MTYVEVLTTCMHTAGPLLASAHGDAGKTMTMYQPSLARSYGEEQQVQGTCRCANAISTGLPFHRTSLPESFSLHSWTSWHMTDPAIARHVYCHTVELEVLAQAAALDT